MSNVQKQKQSRISEVYGIRNEGVKPDFYDINAKGIDEKKYIDPIKVIRSKDWKYRKNCVDYIENYFETLIFCIENNKSINELVTIKEINSTHLGISSSRNRSQGKGPKKKILKEKSKEIFEYSKKVNKFLNPELQKYSFPTSFYLFGEGLGEDNFSDLITSLIYPFLNRYTWSIMSANKNYYNSGVPVKREYWNRKSNKWMRKEFQEPHLPTTYDLILVPKEFLVDKYSIGIDNFVQKIVLTCLQKKEARGKKKPTKKELKEEKFKEKNEKDTTLKMLQNDEVSPEEMAKYIKQKFSN